jgi:hypothetical protein
MVSDRDIDAGATKRRRGWRQTEACVAIKAAGLAIALSLGATQAMAQPGYYYYGGGPIRPPYDVGPIQGLSTRQITRIVRSAGLRPVAQPRRIGRNYIVSSVDRHGVVKRVIIDAMAGEIVRVREARGPIARGDGVRTIGPDAEPFDDNGSPRTHARVPGTPPAAKADRQKKTVASAPAASEKAPPHEADTESLPKAEGAVTIPPQAQPEAADAPKSTASLPSEPAATPEAPKAIPAKPAETRSATVMPARPPLPVRRPSAAAPQPVVAKPDTAAKKETPASSPRVVLPGGPPVAKDETTASTSAPKSEEAPKAAPSAEQPAISIVPPQSYE